MNYSPPAQADIDKWHHWFAVECNNLAWEVADFPRRTAEQTQEMLWSAYASAWHWSRAGKPIHAARAEMLLAWVYALVERSDEAIRHAARARDMINRPVDGVSTWDRAFVQLAEAMSVQASGDRELYRTAFLALEAARNTLDDSGDIDTFNKFANQLTEPA